MLSPYPVLPAAPLLLQAKAGITPDIADKLTACSNELSKGRKKRAISPTGAPPPRRPGLPAMPRPPAEPAPVRLLPPCGFTSRAAACPSRAGWPCNRSLCPCF